MPVHDFKEEVVNQVEARAQGELFAVCCSPGKAQEDFGERSQGQWQFESCELDSPEAVKNLILFAGEELCDAF